MVIYSNPLQCKILNMQSLNYWVGPMSNRHSNSKYQLSSYLIFYPHQG